MSCIRPLDPSLLSSSTYIPPSYSPGDPVPEGYQLNQLEWHQLVAIITSLRLSFDSKARPAPGVLIADDVGVGKTHSSFGVIASLTDLLDRASQPNVPLPPYVGKL